MIPPHDPAAHDVMMRARDFRLNEGLCIPIHYDDAVGAISLGGERPYLDAEAKSALHLIGIFTHGRLRSLTRPLAEAPPRGASPRWRPRC